MRAKEFLKEAQVTPYQHEDLEVAKAVEVLNTYCRQSLALVQQDKPIWRGMDGHDAEIVMIDPSTGERKSQNTTNHYTQLMDNSPYFKGWPRRSKSFICSSGRSYAAAFGSTMYTIFPYDGVKIAVCPERDLWDSQITVPEFGDSFHGNSYRASASDFNSWLHGILRLPPDYEGMVAEINDPTSIACRKAAVYGIEPNQIMPILQKALSPEKIGFKLYSIQEYVAADLPDNELWISGPVIAIRGDMYKRFREAVHASN